MNPGCGSFLGIVVLVLVLACALPLVLAEEQDPRADFAARVQTLPAPSAKHAFRDEVDLVVGDQVLGQATFAARPAAGGALWEIEETMTLGGGAIERRVVTYLDAHLAPLKGTVAGRTAEEGPFSMEWRKTETGFALEVKRGEGKTASSMAHTLAHEGPFLSTLTALFLFCRMNIDRPGSFAATLWDADPGPGEGHFEPGTWTIPPPGTWKEKKAVVMTGTKGSTARVEAGFDAATGAFLGAIFRGPMPQPFEFRLRGADATGEETPEAPDANATAYEPAKTAKAAALQAALGFGSGDLALLENVIDWSSVHASLEAAREASGPPAEAEAEPFPSVEDLKAQILEAWKTALPKNPPDMIRMGLTMAESSLKVETMEGFTRVKFPELFRNLTLDVAEIDGVWKLVRLPTSPK